MMSSKYLFLTILFFIGFSFGNCSYDDCNCSGVFGYFDIEDLELWHVSDADGCCNEFVDIPEGASVKFDDYAGIDVSFVVEYVSDQQKQIDWNFSLLPSALACSCIEEGSNGAKTEKFQKFEVTTLHDFDDAHLANSSINDLLVLRAGTWPLDEYLEKETGENVEYESFVLKPMTTPMLTDSFQVRVEVELTNGEAYTVESGIVRF